jgi:Spy/CpxP family protein refolding chaperone
MKTSLFALALSAVLISSASAQQGFGPGQGPGRFAQGERPRFDNPQGFPADRIDRLAMYLDLTADQKTKIESMQTPHLKKMVSYQNQLDEKQAQLKTQMSADKPDTKKINVLVEEIGSIKTAMQKDRVTHRLSIRETLNDDQKVKFDAMGQRMNKRGGKKAPRGLNGRLDSDFR